jgi:hypothetical protein
MPYVEVRIQSLIRIEIRSKSGRLAGALGRLALSGFGQVWIFAQARRAARIAIGRPAPPRDRSPLKASRLRSSRISPLARGLM